MPHHKNPVKSLREEILKCFRGNYEYVFYRLNNVLSSMKEERVPYNKTDHIHCWSQENPPCGLKGKHRCCLCNEPVPPEHKEED